MKSRMTFALRGWLAFLPAILVANAQQPLPAQYTVTDLGTLGGANSFAYSINEIGMIAGGSNNVGQNDPVIQTATLWNGSKLISLGTLGGSGCPDCSSEGSAARANGSVVLLSETAAADPNGEDVCEFNVNRPFRTNHQCLAAVWRDGTLIPLPTLPGGNNAEAFFVNKKEEAVGVSEIGVPDNTCATPTLVRRFEAVKWAQDGTPNALRPLPGDTVSFAFTNNDAGMVVGFSGTCANTILPPFVPGGPGAPHAVVWDANGNPSLLDAPAGGAGNNVAVGINGRGQITVNSLMQDGSIRALVYSTGTPQLLATLSDNALLTVAPCCNNINNLGQIVGFSIGSDFTPRGVIWQTKDQIPADLNTLVPAGSPWFIMFPAGITERGEIAATALNMNTFESHGVLLSPIHGNGVVARGPINLPARPHQ
jgi:uncharacterized membrane protein